MSRPAKRARKSKFGASKSRFSCVDLFAGAGGFSLAANLVGLKVAAAVEFDKYACETYRYNLVHKGGTKLYEVDMASLEPKTILKDCFSSGLTCDVVLGGPPCQGFSVHRLNDAGKHDPRNSLVHRYFEFVSALKPRVFLLENVPGILWPRHASVLKKFYDEARRAGYRVMPPELVDARDFGLPQGRKRVFILGVRDDVLPIANWVPQKTHGNPSDRVRNPRLKPWVSCAEVFSRKLRANDPNNIHMNHSDEMVRLFKKTPLNGGSRHESGRTLPCHEGHDGHKDVYGRIDTRKPGPTMTTACINPSKGRFLHPTKHHGIALRHAARLQTFPESFVFKGGLMAGGVQVGNAVPVRLGMLLLRRVIQVLKADDRSRSIGRKEWLQQWLEAAE